MQPVPDPYRALGVPRGATEAEIKAAHRKLAKRYHPDGSGGDTERFLSVQEAYRVLSDPLLRRDWDAKHAGPVRASQPAPTKPRTARAHATAGGIDARQDRAAARRSRDGRRSATTGRRADGRTAGLGAATQLARLHVVRERGAVVGGGDRSTREEARPESASAIGCRFRRERHERRCRQRSVARAGSRGNTARLRRLQPLERRRLVDGGARLLPARRPGPARRVARSSTRAPRSLTAARARAAAEAEARQQAARAAREQQRRAASARAPRRRRPSAAYAYASASAGVARDPVSVGRAREQFLKRLRAQHWPNLKERLLYALVAWLPIAVLIVYGGTVGTGCDRGALGCPPQVELVQAGLIGLALLAFVLLPKLAYFGAIGTLGMLLAAAASVTVIAFLEAPLPLSIELVALVGGAMLVGYFVAAGIAVARAADRGAAGQR